MIGIVEGNAAVINEIYFGKEWGAKIRLMTQEEIDKLQ